MSRFFRLLHSLFLTLPAILFIGLTTGCSHPSQSPDKERLEQSLKQLDKVIDNAEFYSNKKYARIDSLKQLMNESEGNEKINRLVEISAQYRQLNSDSAIFYGAQAYNMDQSGVPDSLQLKVKMTLVDALSTSGLFNEALSIFNSIDPKNLSPKEKIAYWRTARFLYAYGLAYLQENNVYSEKYSEKYFESDDSLLNILPWEDNFHRFIYSERLVAQRKWQEARRSLLALLEDNPMESNIYGMSAYQLAEVYKHLGDYNNYIDALSLSAQSDIMGAVNEGIALHSLANQLYAQGNLEEAFKYMNHALKEANNAHIRMRTVSIANHMSNIDQAYQRQLDASRNRMIVYLVIALCLLAVISCLSIILIRNVRTARRREKMMEANSRKLRSYVGNFIGLCSNYSTRIEQMSKLVTRKVNAGQEADLLKILSSGRFTEEDNDEFYSLIDKAVNDIFPDFIESINRLLRPECQIKVEESEKGLTPELRIYACVRMGVEQSARIAQILHYSVNTVYSYRNRMRNRAINRETFDSDVANLGFESDN